MYVKVSKPMWWVMHARPVVVCVFAALVINHTLSGQGLFESAQGVSAGKDSVKSPSGSLPGFGMNGFVKAAFFAGRNATDDPVMQSGYAEGSLKLSVSKSGLGKAFAEIRCRSDAAYKEAAPAFDLREAWATAFVGPLDITLGKQIIAWGRGDAINPTNNVTPMDPMAYSSEFDDTRLGNLLVQAKLHYRQFSVQGIWIPLYRPDVLLFSKAELPSNVVIGAPSYPDNKLDNSGCAFRFDWTSSMLDGSLSYFNGFETQTAFDYTLGFSGISVIPTAYRMHAIGLDFASTIGSLGLRGEAAAKIPFKDHAGHAFVPQRCAQYLFGLDRSIADWTFLVQYSGTYVFDFAENREPLLMDPANPLAQMNYGVAMAAYSMERFNRLFTGTSAEFGHAVTGQVQWNTLFQTLHISLAGMYDFTIEDYAVNPTITYDITDAFGVTVGGRYLDGPQDGLNTLITDPMSSGYVEMKLSF
jgi:hypothetical protein